ncbi:tRNA pseudouridine(13) synthase TruD [Pistricoccus aurantiacus]|uniref:tRNA pseudouridine synthase D n=1 Tax=Pistricoccus aurantiacus TaxID=1883414 RepID=A0A5B8SSM0_9GAMM|nr:tRNA pseudouridine(13) synthase TruD [Pistricoccus aurantiacus]QEA39274.1 tRNA pseudouridine(13) synthase TruD [Pistricoccus aurantiacus]
MSWPPLWPRALSTEPLPVGDYRLSADDFYVEECLGFEPEGQGEHLWLWVEKRDLTTLALAKRVADICSVRPRDIGFSGMKDRQAVTRQWLSVHLPGQEAPADINERLQAASINLLAQGRHPRKLKRGVHRANRFELRLGGQATEDSALETRWQRVLERGVPNYFGPQRFGAQGRNLARATTLLQRGWRKRDDPQGLLLSAARSYLFNELLADRIRQACWDRPIPGDMLMLEGSASHFLAERIDEELLSRARHFDVHPSGVLWGTGGLATRDAAVEIEQALATRHTKLTAGLEKAGVRMARRALRMRVSGAALQREAGGLRLTFQLPRGGFATAVLRELMEHPTL